MSFPLPRTSVILGYRDILGTEPPENRIEMILHISKDHLIAEIAGLNYRLTGRTAKEVDTSFYTQLRELAYFCGGVQPLIDKYSLMIDRISQGKKMFIFTRQTCHWEETYLIKSPHKGTVSLFSYWVKNQHITLGTTVLTIISKYNNVIFARLNLLIRNSGKVKIGQSVNISLDAYPAEEYGYIKGRIQNISLVPENHQYLIIVQLPDQLKTTFGKQLHFKNDMEGDAEVVTEKLSLFERIFTFFHAKKNNQI